MIRIMIIVFATLIGAAMGSFACCQAWRIRLKEEGKKEGRKGSAEVRKSQEAGREGEGKNETT